MSQQEISTRAKKLVKDYLSEGLDPESLLSEELEDEVSGEYYDDIMDEADDILSWLAGRLDIALTGRR